MGAVQILIFHETLGLLCCVSQLMDSCWVRERHSCSILGRFKKYYRRVLSVENKHLLLLLFQKLVICVARFCLNVERS